MMMFRGVRGATTAENNTEESIIEATRELMQLLIETNGIEEDFVASVIFSTTQDLTAAHPARAARELGWTHTALLGCQEAFVPTGLERCIRVLIHWNTERKLSEIKHIYLREAAELRPDLAVAEPTLTNNNQPLNGRH